MDKINLIGLKDHETNIGFDMFPYGIAYLAALTPKKYKVKVYSLLDENDEIEDAGLNGISVMTPVANKAYRLADRIRRNGNKVVLGGVHVSMLPDEAMKHADSVVIGEVEDVWGDILKDYEKGRLKKFYRCDKPKLDHAPLLKKEHFGKTKARIKMLHSTRGCPWGCDFCSVASYNGTTFRHIPVKKVVRQIKELKSGCFNLFSFVDDNIAADPEYAKKLFAAMKPLKIRWVAQCSINIAKDGTLLRLAKESGCLALVIGFETITQESLNNVHKRYKVSEYEEAIKKIKVAGILVFGSFIFGFDTDKKEDFGKTVEFCIKNDMDMASFHPLTPFPGTRLFDKLKKERRITTYNWSRYNWRHVVFKPKNMAEDDVSEGIISSFRRFFSLGHLSWKLLKVLLKGQITSFVVLSAYYFSTRKHLKGVYSSFKS